MWLLMSLKWHQSGRHPILDMKFAWTLTPSSGSLLEITSSKLVGASGIESGGQELRLYASCCELCELDVWIHQIRRTDCFTHGLPYKLKNVIKEASSQRYDIYSVVRSNVSVRMKLAVWTGRLETQKQTARRCHTWLTLSIHKCHSLNCHQRGLFTEGILFTLL